MPKHRDGDKLRGSHTTLIDLAVKIFDIAAKIEGVNGISAGYIESGVGGPHRVKIMDMTGGILLAVRSNRAVQELRVYVKERDVTRLKLCRALRNNGIPICFR